MTSCRNFIKIVRRYSKHQDAETATFSPEGCQELVFSKNAKNNI